MRPARSDHKSCQQGTCSCCASRDCRLKYNQEVLVISPLRPSLSPTHTKHSLCATEPHNHYSKDCYTIAIMSSHGTHERKKVDEPLPDQQTIQEAGQLPIKDKDGNKVPFQSLFTDKDPAQRQLIIFIRHFFCGVSRPSQSLDPQLMISTVVRGLHQSPSQRCPSRHLVPKQHCPDCHWLR